jgi:hypothetical protein
MLPRCIVQLQLQQSEPPSTSPRLSSCTQSTPLRAAPPAGCLPGYTGVKCDKCKAGYAASYEGKCHDLAEGYSG